MSERIVHVIPNLQMKKYERKAVGIYARVSTAHSTQLHSVSLQLSALVQRVYHNGPHIPQTAGCTRPDPPPLPH